MSRIAKASHISLPPPLLPSVSLYPPLPHLFQLYTFIYLFACNFVRLTFCVSQIRRDAPERRALDERGVTMLALVPVRVYNDKNRPELGT